MPVLKKFLILTILALFFLLVPSIGTIGGTDAIATNQQENWQALGWKSDTQAEADALTRTHSAMIRQIAQDAR